MAYTTFSTDNADYVLQLGNHLTVNKQVDIFEGIDALVIETGGDKFFHEYFRKRFPQLDLLLEHCAKSKISVFGTDLIPQLGISYPINSNHPSSIDRVINLLMYLPLFYYGYYSQKEVSESFLDFYGEIEFKKQQPIITGRDAVNARKTEDFVAPTMKQRLNRKPFLGLVYGAAHLGLKLDLQSKNRRDFTIQNWITANYEEIPFITKMGLNKVQEANYNGQKWNFTNHEINLF